MAYPEYVKDQEIGKNGHKAEYLYDIILLKDSAKGNLKEYLVFQRSHYIISGILHFK